MSEAREEILARIRKATADAPRAAPVARDYRRSERGERLLERFAQRAGECGANVHRVEAARVSERIGSMCAERGARRLAVPAELPAAWRPAGVELAFDDALEAAQLDRCDGALTGCAVAIAETGTVVLDGGRRQGSRALTLVPDLHFCVIESDQLVASVPAAIARVADAATRLRRPITFVSGPSATSDIELERVEGVHGPRALELLLVERPTDRPPSAASTARSTFTA